MLRPSGPGPRARPGSDPGRRIAGAAAIAAIALGLAASGCEGLAGDPAEGAGGPGTVGPAAARPAPGPPPSPSPVRGDAGAAPTLPRPFASDSPWNTPAGAGPIAPDSKELLLRARLLTEAGRGRRGTVVARERLVPGALTINTRRWTVPVFSDSQPGAVAREASCRRLRCGPDAVDSVTIPPQSCPDPRYGGWMSVVDTAAGLVRDFWRARCEPDGSISFYLAQSWELDGPGFLPPGQGGVRGSGLPLFAGLITPEEIEAGRIDHALAIAVPGAAERRYVQPASTTDGDGPRRSLPEGARLRLAAGALAALRPHPPGSERRRVARTIVAALRRYGAIVVGRATRPTLFAQRNANWTGTLPEGLLSGLTLADLQTERLGRVFFEPPRAGRKRSVPADAEEGR